MVCITEELLKESNIESYDLLEKMCDLLEIADTFSYRLKAKMQDEDMYDSFKGVFDSLNSLFYKVRTELVKDKEYRSPLYDMATLIKLIDDKLNNVQYEYDSPVLRELQKDALYEKLNNPLEDALFDAVSYIYHVMVNSYKEFNVEEDRKEYFEELVEILSDLFEGEPKEPEDILGFNFRDYWDFLAVVDYDEDDESEVNDSLSTEFGQCK